MGVCASCLGLNRHPSQDGDLDRILDAEQPTYGTLPDRSGFVQPDEEDLRREREALEHITSHATDHMIDVLHPSHVDLNDNLASSNHRHPSRASRVGNEADMDAEEAAWLESIEAAGIGDVQLAHKGALVMDVGLLREASAQQKSLDVDSAH